MGAVGALALAAVVAAVLVVTLARGDDDRGPRLAAPLPSGETWIACADGPELTLARSEALCAGTVAKSSPAVLSAPADARVAALDDGALCLDVTRGGSVRLAPLVASVAVGDTVVGGQGIGELDGGPLRFAVWSGSGCSGDPVPFADAYGTRLLCAGDDPDTVTACPAGNLGPVDLQAACDAQYPGENRTALTRESTSAYTWVCESPTGASGGIEVLDECVRLFGRDVVAVATDPGDPDSWICER